MNLVIALVLGSCLGWFANEAYANYLHAGAIEEMKSGMIDYCRDLLAKEDK